jgi:hypothetical protein
MDSNAVLFKELVVFFIVLMTLAFFSTIDYSL